MTGLILALVGLVAGVVCLIPVLQQTDSGRVTGQIQDEAVVRPNMTVPLLLCGAAVVVGGAMYVFGGPGYFISNDPRERN